MQAGPVSARTSRRSYYMKPNVPVSFAESEWGFRQFFVGMISSLCKEERIDLQWLSEYWVARLEKEGKVQFITAYLFPLNNAAAAGIARDKVATYHVLKKAGVPIVPHYLVRFPFEGPIDDIVEHALAHTPLPLVLKPCDRGSGKDVYKVTSHAELVAQLRHMAQRYQTIAASPLEEIEDEYRVVLLDQEPLLLFRKELQQEQSEWRHNLQFGAVPRRVPEGEMATKLISLAQESMRAIGLRFAAIDLITTPEGLKVMEVNAGFSAGRVGKYPEFSEEVMATYRAALRACFTS